MFRKFFLALSLTVLTAFGTGCEALRQVKYEPSYVMTFYTRVQYPGQTELIERELVDPFTSNVYWVNGNQFFDSRGIQDVELEEIQGEPGMYYLYFKLSRSGIGRWTAMCGHNMNTDIILMIDGTFYTVYKQSLKMQSEKEEWVRCDAKFDTLTANGIKKHVADNYRHYNPDVSSWMI